jgi:DNA-binding response OmpR family regulator
MSKTQILTIGRHPEILQTVVRLVNNNPDWECLGVQTDDEAIAAFTAQLFDLVLLGSGIEPQSEEQLCKTFRAHNPKIIIIQHFGGGSGLLTAEIYEGLRGAILGKAL